MGSGSPLGNRIRFTDVDRGMDGTATEVREECINDVTCKSWRRMGSRATLSGREGDHVDVMAVSAARSSLRR
jgi:hypothetical protein